MKKIITGAILTPTLATGSYVGYKAFTPSYTFEYTVSIDGQNYNFATEQEAEEYKVTHETNKINETVLSRTLWENGTFDKLINDNTNNFTAQSNKWLLDNPHKQKGGKLASANPEDEIYGGLGGELKNNYFAKNEETGAFSNTRLRSVMDEAKSINELLFADNTNLFELDTKAKMDKYVELMIKGAGIDANLNPTEVTLWCGPAQWGPIEINMLTPESLHRFNDVFAAPFNELFEGNKSRGIDLEEVFNMAECTPNTIATSQEGTAIVNIDEIVTYVQSLYVENDFNKYVFNTTADFAVSSDAEESFSKWSNLHKAIYSYRSVNFKTKEEAVTVATDYATENYTVIKNTK